jgi:branched-chain amino acid transport system substrate-binding protein
VGDVLYMRGVVGAMLSVEGVFRAQERFGKGKVMTSAQARWGYENLDIGRGRLGQIGFTGIVSPIKTSCDDHMGSAFARIHTWDGSRFNWSSDWIESDMSIINPMVKASADRYASEKKLARRPASDCNN